MRKIVVLALLVAAIASVAQAKPKKLKADLEGFQEVPAISSTGGGHFQGTLNSTETQLTYTVTFDDLEAPVTQSHIHFAQKSVNGSIIVWLCGSATNPGPTGTPACPQQGTVSGTFTAANVGASATTQQLSAGDLASFIDAMESGIAYVNVHTTLSPGGEIRGQLTARGESGK